MLAAATDRIASKRPLRVCYRQATDPHDLLGPQTMALFGFGNRALPRMDDPRYLRIGLQPASDALYEVWESDCPVQVWRDGPVAGASDGRLSFGWLEEPEGAAGIRAAAEHAYQQFFEHLSSRPHRHPLRIWNYLDAITDGEGDDERYRQFCVGRAEGMQGHLDDFPAATAIGRRDGKRHLQLYWLAAAESGRPLENPRQVAAWRYPREYGPRSPSFARAMLPPAGAGLPLMLSGTAAVVGHRTRHVGDIAQQLEETLRNLDALLVEAQRHASRIETAFGATSPLKIYVREARDIAIVEALLAKRLPAETPRLILHADICRRDLLVEIDGFHDA
ncbi:MAG: pteridine-dependent deoxygenase [Xanthomonadales bacterium]|nr:pteridine-dependent deoxygenase [Xanthomonadales bacterium]